VSLTMYDDANIGLGFVGKIEFEYSATQVFEYSKIFESGLEKIYFKSKKFIFFDINWNFFIRFLKFI